MLVLEPSKELIWEDPKMYGFPTGCMMFSLFWIDPMMSVDEINTKIGEIYDELKLRFDPWVKYYVWDNSPVRLELVSDANYRNNYLYGQLVFDQMLDDQNLVTHILFEFSKIYPDLYIHLDDNDGEFILVDTYEYLPEWLDPSNATNRDWINSGRVLIIPEEYYSNRGLKLIEALMFLEKAVYKCLKILEIDNKLIKELSKYPKKALQNQCELDLNISRIYASLLINSDKSFLNRSVLTAINEEFDPKDENWINDDVVNLKINTTTLCFASIQMFLKKSEELDINSLVSLILNKSIKGQKLVNDNEIKTFNETSSLLQAELKRTFVIKEFTPTCFESLDENIPVEHKFNEEEMIHQLKEFFEDTNAGIHGVENRQADDDTDDETDIYTMKTAEELANDREIEELMKKDGIDEDDFFEFFAKEALKLKDEDLEQFRNLNIQEVEKRKDGEIDEDYDSEEREMFEQLSSNDVSSLQDLLKMFTSGEIDGPAATFLQNLK